MADETTNRAIDAGYGERVNDLFQALVRGINATVAGREAALREFRDGLRTARAAREAAIQIADEEG